MAISFNKQQGSAKKNNANAMVFKDGDNKVRIVGDILARYVYWVKGENDKNIPLECLSFDRDEERFANEEKDWVKEYYPDLKCGWSYATQGIDMADGKLKVINLKKKLWEQVITAAEDLGDPTDPDTGWDINFKRVKTGPLAYNVEYQLQALKCKPRPLSPEERDLTKELKSMDVVMVRPTPDAQKELLDRITNPSIEGDTVDNEALEQEFKIG
jgi:hypothetical protein